VITRPIFILTTFKQQTSEPILAAKLRSLPRYGFP